MKRKRHESHGRARLSIGSGGITYLLTTVLIAVVGIYTQANLLYWAFGLMIGGLSVSLLLSWWSMRSIHVQRVLPAHGIVDQAVMLRYHVTNNSLLPLFSVTVYETWGIRRGDWKRMGPIAPQRKMLKGRPHGWILYLGPRQNVQTEAPCWPRKRGLLSFERIVLTTSFPFGILRKEFRVEQEGQTLVYPHLYRMDRQVMAKLPRAGLTGQKQMSRGGGQEEFFGLRPYHFGDSLKIIDWKHSAKMNKLVSREMTQPIPPRMMVLLDLSDQARIEAAEQATELWRARQQNLGWLERRRQTRDLQSHETLAVERAISLAASVICDAYLKGYHVGLAVQGAPCAAFAIHHSLPHRSRMLDALSRLDTSQRNSRAPALPARPSVIIIPGLAPSETVTSEQQKGKPIVMGALQLEHYVGIEAVGLELIERTRPPTRRAAMSA